MCGICGYIELDNSKKVDRTYIKSMTEMLVHRGPDGTSIYYDDFFTLGFTRLSIIDIENGMQPVTNEDKSIISICNGEIFNYIELRKELISKGHKFKTDCDVEVIVHLYEVYGKEFISHLNGQFSFILYDKKNKYFICARDQFGIAPFYYTIIDNTLIFASEIKAILKHKKVNKEVNIRALDQILTFPGLISPQTMFKDIYSLENGHYLEINSDGNIKNIEYWDLIYPRKSECDLRKDESYYKEELTSRLLKAVEIRMRSDVPVGLYISGGLDSSIIAAMVNKISNEKQRRTFSIDFEDKEISEEKYQNIMVNNLNSIHKKTPVGISDIISNLSKVIYQCETPLKETYDTASYALARSVRNSNIKVVLSGEGADELFGGYVGYKFDKIRMFKGDTNVNPRENDMRRKLWGDENLFYEKDYYSFNKVKIEMYSDNVKEIYDQVNCLNYPVINEKRLEGRDVFQKRSYIDYKLRIVDHLVADHGDRMTFANSVEARYPFLDKDVVEFAKTIPSDLKLNNFDEKYILKEVAKNYVPKQIIEREKFAFVAPGSSDMLKSNYEYFESILSWDTIKRQGYFNPDVVENLKKKYLSKDFSLNLPFESDLLITVITFGMFLDSFGLSNLC